MWSFLFFNFSWPSTSVAVTRGKVNILNRKVLASRTFLYVEIFLIDTIRRHNKVKQDWELEELNEHFTVIPEELRLIGNKYGSTRLGFAV